MTRAQPRPSTTNHPTQAVAPLKPLPVELRVLAERITRTDQAHVWYDNGRDFIQGKAQCKHGQWLDFLSHLWVWRAHGAIADAGFSRG